MSTWVVTVRRSMEMGSEKYPRLSVKTSNCAPKPSHELTSTTTMHPLDVLPLMWKCGGTFSPLRRSTRRKGFARAGRVRQNNRMSVTAEILGMHLVSSRGSCRLQNRTS